ncbi:MAG: hypothetical protein AABY22_09630 [Nanoarchaeota archaeon]
MLQRQGKMCEFNSRNNGRYIDSCMKTQIKQLNKKGITTLACCCGHNKYPKTIVIKHNLNSMPYEIYTKEYLLRKKRFYRKDKQGYYYIPEVLKNKKR